MPRRFQRAYIPVLIPKPGPRWGGAILLGLTLLGLGLIFGTQGDWEAIAAGIALLVIVSGIVGWQFRRR